MPKLEHVLIVHETPLITYSIKNILEEDFHVMNVFDVHSLTEVKSRLEEKDFNLIITDICFKENSTLKLCQDIKKKYEHISILAVSQSADFYTVKMFFNAGVNGFYFENDSIENFNKAIEAIQRDNFYLNLNINEYFVRESKKEHSSFSQINLNKVTKREQQVLRLIVNELTSEEISKELKISINTVEFHRKNLMCKMGVRNMAGLVKKAIEFGIKL